MKKTYTQEQVQQLKANPYTHSVNENRITFTLEFKQFFVEQLEKPGMTTKMIMRAAGYDPDIFSKTTLDRIRIRIRREAASPEGLHPPRGLSEEEKAAQFAAKELSKQQTEKTIKEMQERIVKLEAEITFLKKISAIRKQSKKN